MKRIIYLALFLMTAPVFQLVAQNQDQYPLSVSLTLGQPYPVKLSDFKDINSQVFINITNSSDQDYTIKLQAELRGPIFIRSKDIYLSTPGSCIQQTILANTTTTLTTLDLSEVYDPDNLTASNEIIEAIRGDRALPQGEYELCFRAFDCSTRKALSPKYSSFDGCFSFPIDYVQPPRLQLPSCGEVISEPFNTTTFMWDPVLSLRPGQVLYRFRLVEIDPAGTNPNQAMLSSTARYLVDEEDIAATSFNLNYGADVTLEEGKSYAWQVIAYDPDENITFENNGASEVCYFRYGGTLQGLSFDPIYPQTGDYLPFNFMPFIVKFSPFSNDYIQYNGNMVLKENMGSGYHNIDRKSTNNSWRPDGPWEVQKRRVFTEMTQEQSQHLPVYKTNSEAGLTFQRGGAYSWEFNGEMETNDGEVLSANFSSQEFKIGMAPVNQLAPGNGVSKEPGMVKLEWQAVKPERLFPPFDIVRSDRRRDAQFFTGTLDEHWVLEVSRDSSFDSIYFKSDDRIQGMDILNTPEEDIVAALYHPVSVDTIFNETGTYYWRVKWLKNPADIRSEVYSVSEVFNFVIGEPGEEAPEESAREESECVSGCDAPAITDNTATGGLRVDDVLKIGMFDLVVKSISSSSSNSFTGEGEVEIPFLHFKALVSFQNVQYNAAKIIFSGTVKAKDDREFAYSSTVSNGVEALGMEESTANDLKDYLNTGERLVSLFTGNRAIGLPIGIDKEIEGKQFTIAIVEMVFTPERAHLNAVANIDLDLLDDTHFFSAGIGDFCFSPNGFGKEGKAFLPTDHSFELGGGRNFTLKGLSNATSLNDSSSYSYFNWDCNGFKCLNLTGEYKFSRDVIVPDGEDGMPGEGQVTARMSFKSCRGNNFMASFDMDPFQIPSQALEGYAFVVDEAWVDWSTFDNPPEFQENIPSNYDHAGLRSEEARLRNVWKGFWLKRLHLKVPEYIGNVEREQLEAGISNLIIDNTGFTCSIDVENVVTWARGGHVEGYSFSLDRIYVNIVQNSFSEAGLQGKIGLPISGETEYLEYTAAVDHTSAGTGFKFVVQPKDTLNVPVFIAKASIEPTSTFEIRLGRENFIGVDLNGSMSIASDNQPSSGGARNGALDLNMPGVHVEHLRLNSRDGFDDTDFRYSLASPQKNMSGFPISLDPREGIKLKLNGMNPALAIKPKLTLAGESTGFAASAEIELQSELNLGDEGKQRFRLTGIDLNSIEIEVEGSVSMKGYLEFYKTEAAKGVRGGLQVGLPMGIGAEFNAEFGVYKANPTATFGSRDHYAYWYVDGMVKFGDSGIDLFPPSLLLYGIGGGAYYHMAPAGLPSVTSIMRDAGDSTRSTSSGTRYVPSYDTRFGFKMMALMGSSGSGKAYNFDVSLEANFATQGGLSEFIVQGNARILSKGISSLEEAPIMGSLRVAYHNPPGGDKVVEGDLIITVDVYDVITGVGELSERPPWYTGPLDNVFVKARFYAGPGEWYFHMGTPENRAGLQVAGIARFDSYLMIGHGINPNLPRPSEAFLAIFNRGRSSEDFDSGNDDQLSQFMSGAVTREDAGYAEAEGFALGSSFSFDLNANPWPFYFELGLALGFDINVIKTREDLQVCQNIDGEIGSNGWFAQGQFYAGLYGSFGIRVKLFRERRIPFLELSAGMILKGHMPNPTGAKGEARISYSVLAGLFEGNFSFKAEVGDQCITRGGIYEITFLQDLKPDMEDNDVSVYSSCTAAFAVPINEILEIPREDMSDPPQRVIASVDSWELKDHTGVKVQTYEIEYLEENTMAEMQPKDMLRGNHRYHQKITLKAKELVGGEWVAMDWSESREADFVTGDAPDTFEEENIVFSYPFKNQRFFLKGETQAGKGYMQLNQGDVNNLGDYGSIEFRTHDYKARFYELGQDDYTEVPLVITNRYSTISFDVSGLDNDKYYAVQILKIKIEEPSENTATASTNGLNASVLGDVNVRHSPYAAQIRESSILMNSSIGTITSDIIKKRSLPGPKVRSANEHILYYYYFKTDKQNTFLQKVASEDLRPDYTSGIIEKFEFEFSDNVQFDWLDGEGYRNQNGREIFPSLIDMSINTQGGEFATNSWPVNYYYTLFYGKVRVPEMEIIRLIGMHSLPSLSRYTRIPFEGMTTFTSDSPFKSALNTDEMNRANNPPPSTLQSRMGISNHSRFGNVVNTGVPGNFTIEMPTYKVVQSLSLAGKWNLSSFKSSLAGYMTRSLPVSIGWSGENHFREQYRNAGLSRVDRNMAGYFLRFYPRQYAEFFRVLFTPVSDLNYQATTASNKHSFIMQYRYPAPGREARPFDGSNKRITFNHTP
ncbi:hypothetical protein [Fulvivirga ligni]|uniref:hypothetical protein n=1 Tax=Fulvivirga ligni TaxID=2904246 RepID=UPI001F48BA2E|nr:hypothetical protein [Fulvivirga ligni]UII22905.1 hypothetical protein LVD16_06675 [Fulvivirga ligni]